MTKKIEKLEDVSKEEIITALKEMGDSLCENVIKNLEKTREEAKSAKIFEMYQKLKSALDLEKIPWDSDLSGTITLTGMGVMIDVDEINDAVYVGGLVYAVGYYDVDMERHPLTDKMLKCRTTDTLDDVVSWAIEASTCPFCHSRRVVDTPSGTVACENCGNSWR